MPAVPAVDSVDHDDDSKLSAVERATLRQSSRSPAAEASGTAGLRHGLAVLVSRGADADVRDHGVKNARVTTPAMRAKMLIFAMSLHGSHISLVIR